ncbi:MAG TPA: molybdopterin cofactor-binding domain-containing protein, partial [Thermoanaerobaculia bacterium]|nr:molybdopterin cofactor-binding domain-containing protein [Thermoanaerobaculia bacterium]
VAPSACTARNGVVTAGRREATFGELATAAATMPVPRNVRLKEPRDFRIIGRSLPRPDIAEIVTGRTVYGIDVVRQGMLHASVRRAPLPGARIVRIDDRAARAMPGVRAIVRIPAHREARQFWEGVGVVADSTWMAFKARDALVVELESPSRPAPLPATRGEGGRRPGEGPIITRRGGDVQQAFARAARIVEAEYELPFVAHATMEPPSCVVDARADRCEVWAPTQTPERVATALATYLHYKDVQVHVTALGGGFGRKVYNDYVLEAAFLSKAVGAPIKLTMTREDDLRHDLYRPAQSHRLRAGLDARGHVTAWHQTIEGASVSSFIRGDWKEAYALEESGEIPQSIPNVLTEFRRLDTLLPLGVWRSVSASSCTFAVQSFVDELAHAAGADPVAFRRALIGPRARRALDVAAQQAGWGTPGRARGVAVLDGEGPAVAQIAEVSMKDGELKVDRVVCAIDCGLVVHPDGLRAQVEGGIAFGLSALRSAITIKDGAVEQSNFHDYPILTMEQMPRVEVHIISSERDPEGAGEAPVPCIAPAVANALFALTGRRVRRLPLTLD